MTKAILAILDGYGYAKANEFNAVTTANTPFLDGVLKKYNWNLLKCSGQDVGLPEGQMGNSEVGHLNIGAGRIVYQELTRITKDIKEGGFFKNAAFNDAVKNVNENNSKLHLMGLLSDGGVHSELSHLKALLKLAKLNGVKNIFVHCFMDGRDTLPTSGIEYVRDLEEFMQNEGVGEIATVIGRYYAMDRDKRYDRLERAYNAIVLGEGESSNSAQEAIEDSYEKNITDEFIVPHIISTDEQPAATIENNDSVIFFNFRADRARELTDAISQEDFSGFERKKVVKTFFVCMTPYDANFKNINIAYHPQILKNTLGEYLSNLGKKQLRIAETEKYAHVTYFFNGGVEKQYPYEERVLVESPKVATYDLKPEMSANEVTDKLIKAIESEIYDFILVNYANCDMVGHTGVMNAAVKAVETVDSCIEKVYNVAQKYGYTLMITADHGNAEVMFEDGKIITSHTTNPVIFAVCSQNVREVKQGSLCDIAPTVLEIMELTSPQEMTGNSLI